jgi:hypothetical protein
MFLLTQNLLSLKVLSSEMDPAGTELKDGALNFKVLSLDGGRTDFSENLRTSLFNDNLSNEPLSERSILLHSTFNGLFVIV